MRYWTRTLIGLAISGASIVAIDFGVYHLVRTGTCASGGPYVSARPCPPGTGSYILALIGGIFGGLIGIAVYATRGGRGRPATVGLALIMWSLLFVTLAASTALAAFGPANNDDDGARTAAIVLGVIFVPMGLAPLPLALGARGKRRTALELATAGRRCQGRVLSVEDTGVTINDNPRVKITVQAEPPGQAPFTVVKTATVSRVRIPRAGDTCVVFYDPADREGRNGISFDPVPGFTAPPPAAAQPAAAPPPAAPQPAEADDDDPLAKIARLGELRDRGLVTPEEFEAQKRRLLDEL